MAGTGRLHGLTVVCWIIDHYHPSLNLGVGISEGCFIFDFASLLLGVTRPICPTMWTKVAVKQQYLQFYLISPTRSSPAQ